jgi:hypothetical protein
VIWWKSSDLVDDSEYYGQSRVCEMQVQVDEQIQLLS